MSFADTREPLLVSSIENSRDVRKWPLHARIALVGGVAAAALTGCAPTTVEGDGPTASPEATKSQQDYIAELVAFSDPSELALPAGATPDDFGRWIVDLTNSWSAASCSETPAIKDALHNLPIDLVATDFYQNLAVANAKAPIEAEFGPDWKSNDLAVKWRSAMVQTNARGIDLCVQSKKSEIATSQFVSAKDMGSNGDGDQVYEIVDNVVSSDPETTGLGQWTTTYVTGTSGENVIIKDFEFHFGAN
jgi:hypothetical protein